MLLVMDNVTASPRDLQPRLQLQSTPGAHIVDISYTYRIIYHSYLLLLHIISYSTSLQWLLFELSTRYRFPTFPYLR